MTVVGGVTEVLGEYASRAKAAWARLIRKVYEADPLECPYHPVPDIAFACPIAASAGKMRQNAD